MSGVSSVSYAIKVNGIAIPDNFPVTAVQVHHSISRLSSATVSLLDGDPLTGDFAISASDVFVPGNMLSVAAGYGGQTALLFEGVITTQALRIQNGGSVLEVKCQSEGVNNCASSVDPTTDTVPVMTLTYGDNMLSFSAELTAVTQVAKVKSTLAGEVGFRGSALVPGKYVSLAGLGQRFNGDHFVSAVRHDIAESDWTTAAHLGLSARRRVVLDDQSQQITVNDDNGNSILMSDSGIAIKSEKNISLEAGQKIILKGEVGIDLQSPSGDVDTGAMNIRQSADLQFAAKGAMSVDVQSSAQLTLKAAMIMIN
jgi:hypothetical protein